MKLISLGAGHGDLNVLISEVKDMRTTAKTFMNAQSAGEEISYPFKAKVDGPPHFISLSVCPDFLTYSTVSQGPSGTHFDETWWNVFEVRLNGLYKIVVKINQVMI